LQPAQRRGGERDLTRQFRGRQPAPRQRGAALLDDRPRLAEARRGADAAKRFNRQAQRFWRQVDAETPRPPAP